MSDRNARMVAVALFTILTVILPACSSGPEPPSYVLISGKVVDSEGAPYANTEVAIQHWDGDLFDRHTVTVTKRSVGADGEFEIRTGYDADRELWLQVTPGGYMTYDGDVVRTPLYYGARIGLRRGDNGYHVVHLTPSAQIGFTVTGLGDLMPGESYYLKYASGGQSRPSGPDSSFSRLRVHGDENYHLEWGWVIPDSGSTTVGETDVYAVPHEITVVELDFGRGASSEDPTSQP